MVNRETALVRMQLHGERLYRNLKEQRSYIGLSIFPEDTLEPSVLQALEAEGIVSWTMCHDGVIEYALIPSRKKPDATA